METSVHPTENSRATQTKHPSQGWFLTKTALFSPLSWPVCLGRATLDRLSLRPKCSLSEKNVGMCQQRTGGHNPRF